MLAQSQEAQGLSIQHLRYRSESVGSSTVSWPTTNSLLESRSRHHRKSHPSNLSSNARGIRMLSYQVGWAPTVDPREALGPQHFGYLVAALLYRVMRAPRELTLCCFKEPYLHHRPTRFLGPQHRQIAGLHDSLNLVICPSVPHKLSVDAGCRAR
jgi:hypothetical protein